MATASIGTRIDDLIAAEQWEEARALIEKALKKEPESHWLWTQLGETYYEQRAYKRALEILLKARDIVPDCPLMLWHLAGTLDALGYHAGAVQLYTWLLRSRKTPKDDPCWESEEWTDTLKTDCVFRMGICFEKLKKKALAANCFRRYIDIILLGIDGSYSLEEAREHIQKLNDIDPAAAHCEFQEAADILPGKSRKRVSAGSPPELDLARMRKLQEA